MKPDTGNIVPNRALPTPVERVGRRKAAGWSQTDVGVELERRTGLKVHAGQVSRLERGERTVREPLRSAYRELLEELAGGQP